MGKESNEKKYSGKSPPTRSLNLIEKMITQESKDVISSKPLRVKALPEKGKSRSTLAGEPKHDAESQLDQHMHNQLHEMMQQREFQKVIDSPPQAARYLLNAAMASDAFAGKYPETGLLPVRLFNLDEIPPLRVWHGSKCEFLISVGKNLDVELSVSAEPLPKGNLTIERSSDTSWLFCYSPDLNDKFPFTVTITDNSSQPPLFHAFELTPLVNLSLEQTVFGLESHVVPEIIDFGKPEIIQEKVEHTHFQDPGFVFNYKRPTIEAAVTLRKVQIIGKTIVFDSDDDPYGLYATFNGAQDIERFEIYAETMAVRSPLRLYQTNIFIHAKELRFEGDVAQIKTTPWERTEKPGTSQPGEDGLTAGDITLNLGSLRSDPAPANVKRFDLSGGPGQAGGVGKNGTNGPSIDQYWKDFQWKDSGISFKKTAPGDWWIIYQIAYCQSFLGIPIKAFSNGTENGWPGDGKPAVPSGKPGEGGNGGVLTSTVDLFNDFFIAGGKAGAAPNPPGGYYRGGVAGRPIKSIKYKAYYMFAARFIEIGKHESKSGKNEDVKYPEKPYGATGAYRTEGNRYAWLNPILMTKLLNYAKDDYLGNRIKRAGSRLENYCKFLDGYRSDPSWKLLQQTDPFELEQIHDEMQILLHRIRNNLDYFGNPAGWVPLLSFEVNRTIFSNEIDRASSILYYIYCIKNKASSAEKTFHALESARSQLEKDIEAAISQYDETISKISALTTQAENLQKKTVEVQFKLQAKEEELKNKSAPPAWLTMTRLSLKISGTIISMIPVYQPAMGMVGSGMTLLSDLDPDKPWETIIGAADITTTFLNSSYDNAAGDLKDKMTDKKKLQTADPRGSLSKKINYLNSARKSASALSAGLKDIQGFMEKQSVPDSKMIAELEKLKSQSKEYQGLVQEIKNIIEQKRNFAEKLATAMQDASSLSNFVNRSILAVDAMYLDMEKVQRGLDKRTISYLEDMERRTYDRLLKYHYYMAKAYEYRLLEPYTQPLDFKQLIKRLEQLAGVDSWDKLSAQTFMQTYSVVYKEKLAEIASQIFQGYNERAREGSFRFEYLLLDDDLKRLNRGQTITVDFARYLPNEENLRIIDLRILMYSEKDRKGDIKTTPVKGKYPPNAYIDLTFSHPGISWIKSAGNVYQFLHQHIDGGNPLVWRARYHPGTDLVDHSTPSAASESLLRSLLEGDALSDMMLYSRPSVWSDLQVSKSGYPNNGGDVDITHLRLELSYDYFKSSDSIVYKEIIVTAIQSDNSGLTTASEADFEPYFTVEKPDRNLRQDARGSFLRCYSSDWNGQVTITAQPKYGDWVFNKWTDVTGHDLTQAKDNTIVLDLKNSEVVCAQYLTPGAGGRKPARTIYALPNAQIMLSAKK